MKYSNFWAVEFATEQYQIYCCIQKIPLYLFVRTSCDWDLLAEAQENHGHAWRFKHHLYHTSCKPANTPVLTSGHRLCSQTLYLVQSISSIFSMMSSWQFIKVCKQPMTQYAATNSSALNWHIPIAIFTPPVAASIEDCGIFPLLWHGILKHIAERTALTIS